MANWTKLTKVGNIPLAAAQEFVVDGYVIALFNIDGTFYALDGVCPHQGGPLGRGELEGCIVTCPWHGWQFDVRTGRHQFNTQCTQHSFPLRVEADWILVDLG